MVGTPSIAFASMEPTTFLTLPYDILYRIAHLLKDDSAGWKGLKALSLTCRELRASCIPVLFERFVWRRGWAEISASLWACFRHFTLHVTTRITAERVDIINRLLRGAEHAKALECFRCMCDGRAADSTTDPWPELISTLSNFPSLSVLEFVGFHWSTNERGTLSVDMPSSLLEFNYVRTHKYNSGNVSCQRTWCGLPRDALQNFVEANSLTLLVTANHRTLTKLTLPGEMSRFDVLALVNWPSLTELVIQGFPPAYESAPLICWLQPSSLPSLQKLRIRLGRGSKETFIIFPQGYVLPNHNSGPPHGSDPLFSADSHDPAIQCLAEPVNEPESSTSPGENVGNISDVKKDCPQHVTKEDISLDAPTIDTKRPEQLSDNAMESDPKDPSGEASSNVTVLSVTQADSHELLEYPARLTLSDLRSLYVSNPSPDDLFWECIPSTLDELALLSHPHWSHHGLMYDNRLSYEANLSSLTSGELVSILKKIPVRSLTMLRVSFWEGLLDNDLALIDFIVSSYPSLHRLEIHRYTSLERNQNQTRRFSASDLARLCDRLRALESLRHLRLDIAYPDTVEVRSGYDYWGTIPDQMTKFDETSQERATFVLQKLPQLQTLGLSCVGEYLEFYWKLYTPLHEDAGSVIAKLDKESNTKYPIID